MEGLAFAEPFFDWSGMHPCLPLLSSLFCQN